MKTRKKWTLLENVHWLQRVGEPSDIIFVAGNVDYCVEQLKKQRDDVSFFKPDRLRAFVNIIQQNSK